ncbi:hypothetical protein T439DRAFT_353138 [Meredithblackwellia eburnea MCA 4105]
MPDINKGEFTAPWDETKTIPTQAELSIFVDLLIFKAAKLRLDPCWKWERLGDDGWDEEPPRGREYNLSFRLSYEQVQGIRNRVQEMDAFGMVEDERKCWGDELDCFASGLMIQIQRQRYVTKVRDDLMPGRSYIRQTCSLIREALRKLVKSADKGEVADGHEIVETPAIKDINQYIDKVNRVTCDFNGDQAWRLSRLRTVLTELVEILEKAKPLLKSLISKTDGRLSEQLAQVVLHIGVLKMHKSAITAFTMIDHIRKFVKNAMTMSFDEIAVKARELVVLASRVESHLDWEGLCEEQRPGSGVHETKEASLTERRRWNRSFTAGLDQIEFILQRAELAIRTRWARVLPVGERKDYARQLKLFERCARLEIQRLHLVTVLREELIPGRDRILHLGHMVQTNVDEVEDWATEVGLSENPRMKKAIRLFRRKIRELKSVSRDMEGTQNERISRCISVIDDLQPLLKDSRAFVLEMERLAPIRKTSPRLKGMGLRYNKMFDYYKHHTHAFQQTYIDEKRTEELLGSLLELHWPEGDAEASRFARAMAPAALITQMDPEVHCVDDIMPYLSLRQANRVDTATRLRFSLCPDQARKFDFGDVLDEGAKDSAEGLLQSGKD